MVDIDKHIFRPNSSPESNVIATYQVRSSKDLLDAAKAIAIGQSIGNPEKRALYETDEMLDNHLAKIMESPESLSSSKEGTVNIAYPIANFNIPEDGVTQLLCTLMGGQMDIDSILACRLTGIRFPSAYEMQFKGPKFGMDEIRARMKATTRPILGGIIKPKTGMPISQLEKQVLEMLEGGVDFIKEDEVLGDPECCRFRDRVPKIARLVNGFSQREGHQVYYAPCINADYPHFLNRAVFASESGAKAVHVNFWAGLSSYSALRNLDLPDTAIFFQKSGDKVITGKNNPYGIDWHVFCQLARMMGSDFIHAGMWGGYLSDSREDLDRTMKILTGNSRYKPTIPSLSCGSNPGLIETTVRNYGNKLMMNVGGAIQGHPMGTKSGAVAMRQAMECTRLGKNVFDYMQDKPELRTAIEKWGYVNPVNGNLLYKK